MTNFNWRLWRVLGVAAGVMAADFAAAETKNAKQPLLELTGGRRVKVVWNQSDKIKLFDTKDGEIRELPLPGGQALLTADGRRVLCTGGKPEDRKLLMYDTETSELTTLCTGPESNLLTIWRDPKTQRDWVYVNDVGADPKKGWEAPGGAIHRFPIDKPESRELFWDRTTSHFYLMFSADGTRACFEPKWSNIGQLKLVCDAQGRTVQDKCTFKPLGGGCFPGMAPDNSYRIFRLDGAHKSMTMSDADGSNPRKIDLTGMPGVGEKKRQIWLTRWSTHPRYVTLMGPDGNDARIWFGRFDDGFTKVEAWVPVSPEGGPKCWQSHAWIEPQQ